MPPSLEGDTCVHLRGADGFRVDAVNGRNGVRPGLGHGCLKGTQHVAFVWRGGWWKEGLG